MSDVRKVTVTSCVAKKRKDGTVIEGIGPSGKPWRLHSILATDDTGLPIQDELVSFDPLPVGEPVDLEFVRKDDPKYGVSYTVSLPKGSRAPRPQMTDDSHEMLREQMQILSDRIGVLERRVLTDVPAPPITPVPVPDDEKIPF